MNTERGVETRYVSKWDAELEHPIRWLPMGHSLDEKLERIEMIHEQIQVYRIWKLARKTVPPSERDFFDREIERMETFFLEAI